MLSLPRWLVPMLLAFQLSLVIALEAPLESELEPEALDPARHKRTRRRGQRALTSPEQADGTSTLRSESRTVDVVSTHSLPGWRLGKSTRRRTFPAPRRHRSDLADFEPAIHLERRAAIKPADRLPTKGLDLAAARLPKPPSEDAQFELIFLAAGANTPAKKEARRGLLAKGASFLYHLFVSREAEPPVADGDALAVLLPDETWRKRYQTIIDQLAVLQNTLQSDVAIKPELFTITSFTREFLENTQGTNDEITVKRFMNSFRSVFLFLLFWSASVKGPMQKTHQGLCQTLGAQMDGMPQMIERLMEQMEQEDEELQQLTEKIRQLEQQLVADETPTEEQRLLLVEQRERHATQAMTARTKALTTFYCQVDLASVPNAFVENSNLQNRALTGMPAIAHDHKTWTLLADLAYGLAEPFIADWLKKQKIWDEGSSSPIWKENAWKWVYFGNELFRDSKTNKRNRFFEERKNVAIPGTK